MHLLQVRPGFYILSFCPGGVWFESIRDVFTLAAPILIFLTPVNPASPYRGFHRVNYSKLQLLKPETPNGDQGEYNTHS